MWIRADLSLRAPNISGYAWKDYPRTMLVYFNGASGCACATDLNSSIKQVLEQSSDVVVLGKANRLSQLELGSLSTNSHVKLISTENLACPDPLAEGQSRLYCVRDGWIVKRAYGTIVPAIFLTKEGIGK
jgi:hypothetical protein